MAYWYCLKHNTVEGDEGCPSKDRLGPYEDQATASRALDIAAERTRDWENDPNWNDDAPSADEPEE